MFKSHILDRYGHIVCFDIVQLVGLLKTRAASAAVKRTWSCFTAAGLGRRSEKLEVLLSLSNMKHSLFTLASLNSGSRRLRNETQSAVFRRC